jgi:hypothetical protein
MSVPGIGPIISSAMVAAIGSGSRRQSSVRATMTRTMRVREPRGGFSKGRDFAAWLGLVPKQISTGDRTILGSISKRGNRYLRVLFVQAAWVTLVKVSPNRWEGHGLKPWIEAAKKAIAPQRACDRACQQARAYRLERARSWSRLRDEQAASGVIIRKSSSRFARQGLREDETRWGFGFPGACEHW